MVIVINVCTSVLIFLAAEGSHEEVDVLSYSNEDYS